MKKIEVVRLTGEEDSGWFIQPLNSLENRGPLAKEEGQQRLLAEGWKLLSAVRVAGQTFIYYHRVSNDTQVTS